MCGITGYIEKNNNAFNVIKNVLEELEYHCYDSTSMAITTKF